MRIKILAVTQRPSEADKTILSNAATINVFQLGRHADRKQIALEIDVSTDMLQQMIPLEWVEFKRSDMSLKAGKLGARRIKKIR